MSSNEKEMLPKRETQKDEEGSVHNSDLSGICDSLPPASPSPREDGHNEVKDVSQSVEGLMKIPIPF